jgi:hypothetical protein
MRGAVSLLPQYAFMVWCSVKQRDNFTFIDLNKIGYEGVDWTDLAEVWVMNSRVS